MQKPLDFVQFRTSAAVMNGYWLGLNVPPPGPYHLPPHPELLRSATMTNALDRTTCRGGLEIVIVDVDLAADRPGLERAGHRLPGVAFVMISGGWRRAMRIELTGQPLSRRPDRF